MKNWLHIFKNDDINFSTTVYLLLMIAMFSGIFGFIYETLFCRIDLGYFVKRGTTYGPWIPIYAIGGFCIVLITYRFKKNPLVVFLINCLLTGVLEYLTGYILLKWLHIRLWDYNNEILNFGNINGFVCLRSILFFGVSSLFLIYIIVPILVKLSKKIPQKVVGSIAIFLASIFILDKVLYTIIR